jgi:hypothetical protein
LLTEDGKQTTQINDFLFAKVNSKGKALFSNTTVDIRAAATAKGSEWRLVVGRGVVSNKTHHPVMPTMYGDVRAIYKVDSATDMMDMRRVQGAFARAASPKSRLCHVPGEIIYHILKILVEDDGQTEVYES